MSYSKNALDFFKLRLNQVVTSEELAKIPGKYGNPISHNMRRIFELRDEQGYDIVNHNNNNETGLNLKVNEWILRSLEPKEINIRSRQINKRIRSDVFERDNFTCTTCGRDASDNDPLSKVNKKITLHLGHKISLSNQINSDSEIKELGEIDDFITQCNVCNEGFKKKDIKPIDWIKKIENLDEENKKNIYNYLKSIFN